jgi:lysophospholipase L1-like esterase/dienelactone hydrolase
MSSRKIQKLVLTLIALAAITLPARADSASLAKVDCVSLDGKAIPAGNPIDGDRVKTFASPALLLFRSEVKPAQGTVLLFPGGGYNILEMQREGENTARFLNQQGFDVAILEYHVASDAQTRDLALADAVAAFRLLKNKAPSLGLHNQRLGIMGYSAGGHLAARTVRNLGENEQSDDLILVYPAYLDECIPGTVIAAVQPPKHPRRLFVAIAANDNPAWVPSSQEYTKTWVGYGGQAGFHLLATAGHGFGMPADSATSPEHWADLLKDFLLANPAAPSAAPNPAAVPAAINSDRHKEKVTAASKGKYDLILVGDSITHNFEKAEYQQVWNQFFAPRHALNLGFGGYRTENVLWNLQNGELDGQSPKVITLMIGTNNVDEKNYPTRHTASQVAGGIEAIVKVMREKCPDAKILIIRSFPGCYGGPNPTSHRAILDRASELAQKLADGRHVCFCDVNHVFLNLNGTIKNELMPDWLHPNPAGAKLWAQAMEPVLSELMGDASLDTEKPANTAIVPTPKLEEDGYDWLGRHAEILKIKESVNPDLVFIGDSITHAWGGLPETGARTTGDGVLKSALGPFRVLNLGFGWDRTQNVLWRLDRGELDGLHPRAVVINIGTNNTSQTDHARQNTPAEIAEGVKEICGRVRSKLPQTKIILMAVFPREKEPSNPRRQQINEINRLLAEFARPAGICFADIGPKLLAPDGTLPPEIAPDFCHPTEKGYQIWADAILPLIAAPQ